MWRKIWQSAIIFLRDHPHNETKRKHEQRRKWHRLKTAGRNEREIKWQSKKRKERERAMNGGRTFLRHPQNSITPYLQLSTLNPLYWIQSVCQYTVSQNLINFMGKGFGWYLQTDHLSIEFQWNYAVIERTLLTTTLACWPIPFLIGYRTWSQ